MLMTRVGVAGTPLGIPWNSCEGGFIGVGVVGCAEHFGIEDGFLLNEL